MPRRTMTCCLSALLGSSLVLGALPGDASAVDAVDAPIENPDLASPQVPAGTIQKIAPTGWDGEHTQLFSADRAGHDRKLQAASLSDGSAGTLSTRLWRVQKGAGVTVTWDDSPSPLTNCGTDDPTKGQQYRVSAGGEADSAQTVTTEGTTRGQGHMARGALVLLHGRGEQPADQLDVPEGVRLRPDRHALPGDAGPGTGAVRHQEGTAAHAPGLPGARADRSPAGGAGLHGRPRTCHFEKDERYSYRYYDRPRMVGQAYINCTRNALTDKRPVNWEELPYDNITQYLARHESDPQKPKQQVPGPQGLQQQADSSKEHQTDVRQAHKNIAVQIAAGFTRADGNPLEMATNNPLLYGRKEQRDVTLTVQPGEVSWIEVQGARERLAGTLIHDTKHERMNVFADLPSGCFGDRMYQRTGPMSKVELARCADARDNARTPDNSIGAPTLRNVPHLVPIGEAAKGVKTRTVPLTADTSRPRD
ncbi:hypothetical protein [Streptomyces kanamyceticus]|uniref:hypothetical protein n=1 Tax=Streptomyces kanamyceticus TaxID=1967 RepID=UPI0037DDCA06